MIQLTELNHFLKLLSFVTGFAGHMAPEVAVNNIPNLTISVNKSGVSDNVTLLVAYKDLDRHQNDINTKRPDISLADGHGSWLYEQVLSFLEQNQTWLFIL